MTTTTQFNVGDRVQVDGRATAHPYALGKVVAERAGKIIVEIPAHQINRYGRQEPIPHNMWEYEPKWLKLVK